MEVTNNINCKEEKLTASEQKGGLKKSLNQAELHQKEEIQWKDAYDFLKELQNEESAVSK